MLPYAAAASGTLYVGPAGPVNAVSAPEAPVSTLPPTFCHEGAIVATSFGCSTPLPPASTLSEIGAAACAGRATTRVYPRLPPQLLESVAVTVIGKLPT